MSDDKEKQKEDDKKEKEMEENWADVAEAEEAEEEEEDSKDPEETDDYGPVVIRRPDDKWGELSNFWPLNRPIAGPDGIMCRTAEHLLQVLQYTYEGANTKTRVLREYIGGAPTPLQARYLANGLPRYRNKKGMEDVLRLRAELIKGRYFGKKNRDNNNNNEEEEPPLSFDSSLARPREDWDPHNIAVMQHVINAKFTTDERAYTALMSTGTRDIHADLGAYDLFWGIGSSEENKGQNWLGRLLQTWRDQEAQRIMRLATETPC